MGLVLDEVRIKGGPAQIGGEPFSINLDTPGNVEVEVSAQSLERFLEELAPGGLKGFTVSLGDGVIDISARARMIVEIAVRAQCGLKIEDSERLHVTLIDVDVAGMGAQRMVESQLDKINPILDASQLPLQVTLDEAIIEEGRVLIRGRIAPA